MRKRILVPPPGDTAPTDGEWLDLETLAEVEITSEDAAHPIEHALLPGQASGWRAAEGGPQTIRLLFDRPQRIRQIRLRFVERDIERTQEYVLRGSLEGGAFHEFVRQRWNFSPHGGTVQTENHRVDLPAVAWLELTITPDISGRDAVASLEQLQLA